jgi:hypothetical protein
MITLPSAIKIASIVINGVEQAEYSLGPQIDYAVFYSDSSKRANATINGFYPILLWSGKDYDAAGQFTDADTDKRLLEVLGSDPEKYLNDLNKKRETPKPAANKTPPVPSFVTARAATPAKAA